MRVLKENVIVRIYGFSDVHQSKQPFFFEENGCLLKYD